MTVERVGAPGTSVSAQAHTLLRRALSAYQASPRAAARLRRQLRDFEEPLRVAVVGRPQSGKSTVVGALVGHDGMAELGPGTPVPTWYVDGQQARASAHAPGRPPVELPGIPPETPVPEGTERVVVEWPSSLLHGLTLVDTPGVDAETEPAELARVTAGADAVLYLADRGPRAAAGSLRALHASPVARAAPVGTIAVVSRADELGGGRIDALATAKLLSRTQAREPAVAAWCQHAVPVAGLVASGGHALRDTDIAALTRLAGLPQNELAVLQLSADRFTASELAPDVPTRARTALLRRFGIFGVRLVTALLRGEPTAATLGSLSAELLRRSGLTELRETVADLVTARRDVLKARSALLCVEAVCRAEPVPAARELLLDLQRTLAGAHEFRELRLLAALRGERSGLPEDLVDEAAQLVGGHGSSPRERLGSDADDTELLDAAFGALEQWRFHAEHPLAPRETRDAAQVVVRSCERLVVALSPGVTE